MKVTLDSFDYVQAASYFSPAEAKAWYGVDRRYDTIVIHWWGNPVGQKFDSIVNYFAAPTTETSIHFVVSGTRITQMVNMGDVAFHAMSANPISIGIEVDPAMPGKTIETVGALVKFIREYMGKDMYLSGHSRWVNTSCPGNVDINKIEAWSRNPNLEDSAPVPPPVVIPPTPTINYRVKDNAGKQLGAYTKQESAWTKFIQIGRSGSIVDSNGVDVTKDFINKFDPPVIPPVITPPDVPTPPLENEPSKTDVEQNTRLTAIEALLQKISDFLTGIFKGWGK